MFKKWRNTFKESGTLPPVELEDLTPRRPRRDFKELYPRGVVIRLLVKDNPKRKGSQAARRYDLYISEDVTTVGGALDVGILYKDIDHDWHSNYISLDGAMSDGDFGE